MKVQFISKKQAESITSPDQNVALVSIREPAEHVDLASTWRTVLKLEFHDSDPSKDFNPLGICYDDQVLFDEIMAKNVIEWLNSLPYDVDSVIVHCHAGVSRSAAVAKFICTYYNMNHHILDNYSLYNKHVYRVLNSVFIGDLYN